MPGAWKPANTTLLRGLGSSVLDAFQYKVPVATTDAGGLKETVQNRGLLSPLRNPKALAENINRLLNDQDLSKQFTEKALAEVKEKYNLQKASEEYLKLFESLVS